MTGLSRRTPVADRIAEAIRYLTAALQSLGSPSSRDLRRAGACILRAARSLQPRRQGDVVPSPAERARLAASHAILEDAIAALKRG